MWGNISLLINSICTVVVFTLALVTASTMSMAIRERFRELAVLKALGFRRRQLVACILAESFGLAFAGALVGVGGAAILFSSGKFAFFPVFELTPAHRRARLPDRRFARSHLHARPRLVRLTNERRRGAQDAGLA